MFIGTVWQLALNLLSSSVFALLSSIFLIVFPTRKYSFHYPDPCILSLTNKDFLVIFLYIYSWRVHTTSRFKFLSGTYIVSLWIYIVSVWIQKLQNTLVNTPYRDTAYEWRSQFWKLEIPSPLLELTQECKLCIEVLEMASNSASLVKTLSIDYLLKVKGSYRYSKVIWDLICQKSKSLFSAQISSFTSQTLISLSMTRSSWNILNFLTCL